MKSYSQIGQDIFVVEFYKELKNGIFIDIGAYDGIEFSNSYLLESEYKWKGICVEPNPGVFAKLIQTRPRSICTRHAIYKESGKSISFDIANQFDMLSGISETIDKHSNAVNSNKTTITVQTLSLTDLLDTALCPTFVHYLSLDTEGSEFEILKTFNFNKYKFGLIDVEHNFEEPKRTQIRCLLLSKGYQFLSENKHDDRYILR